MVLDEIQAFFGCSEKSLLDLPIARFWDKHKNMSIIKLRKKLDDIGILRIAQSKEGGKEIDKMVWQLEQLMGTEKVDSLSDIKARMKQMKKAAKEGKKK